MALNKEIYDTLPDAVKADYVEHEGAYVPAATLEVNQLTSKVTALKGSLDSLDGKLKEQAKAEAEKIEAARQAALEEARTKGDVKAIEERYQQQMKDLEERTAERVRGEVTKEFTQKQAEQKAASIAESIGLAHGVDKDAGEAVADLIRSRVKVDPETGKEIYHDAKGSALSVDKEGFIETLKKEPRFKHLLKAAATTGGGFANGSNGGSASTGANDKAAAAKKAGDLTGFLKATLTQ